MDKSSLKDKTIEQLDKMFAALPVSNPLRDLVAEEIEARVAKKPAKDTAKKSADISKALDVLTNL